MILAAAVAGCSAPRSPAPVSLHRAANAPGLPGLSVETGHELLAAQVARLLPRATARVERALGQKYRLPRIRLCGTRACMAALARNPRRNAESTRDGLLLGPGAFRPGTDLEKVLAHELVHALFRHRLGRRYWRVPAWFHEGVAVMVSGNGGGRVSEAAARHALRGGNHFTFYCRRDPFGFRRSFRPGGQLYYRQAGMFVRHISGEPSRFYRLIAAVLKDGDVCGAYQRLYGQDLRARWQGFRKQR